jgi:hypothetical protein
MRTFQVFFLAGFLFWASAGTAQHFGAVNTDSESTTVMAGSLALDGQTNWFYYNSIDAPQGAYMGWLFGEASTVSARLVLPKTLAAGRYYVFFYGIDYDNKKSIQASIGGAASAPVKLEDRDANGYWTDRAVVDVASPSNTVTLTINRNPSLAGDQRYLFQGIYITTNAEQTVSKTGVAIKLVYPTVMDDSAPVKGNLVRNGGFETPVDSSWGFAGGARLIQVNTMWDSTQGHDGTGSLKWKFDSSTRVTPSNNGEQLISRVYHLKPNKKYTLSLWAKMSPPLNTTVNVMLVNTYVPPSGYPAQHSISSGPIAVTDTAWKRISVTGYSLEYPTSDYQIYINTGGTDGSYLLLDDVQLEEGDLTDYVGASELEAGVFIDMNAKPANIYYTDEALSAELIVRNNTTSAKTKTLRYEIYDYVNSVVRQGSSTVSVPAKTTQRVPFDLSTNGNKGIFRAVTWFENSERSERELSYAILTRPPTMGADPTSSLGIHANYTESQLKMLQRMGIKWSRAMSPSPFCRWNVAEPQDDQFVWYDNELQKASSYGITTMCTIGTNDHWPAWADNGGLPNLQKWGEFVGQLVGHYQSSIKYWEVWNESYAAFTPKFYAQMLKVAADAIEATDPTAKIVGMGGDPPQYILDVIAALETQYPSWDWKQHIDVLSTHDYPGGIPPESLQPIINTYGLPVWNTEAGAWDLGFYQGVNSNFVAWGKNLWPHIDASRYYEGMIGAANELTGNFLRTIASGQTNYFYYDSRIYAAPNYFARHPTMLDYDGTLKTKGIAYAIAGSLVDHSVGLGNASPDPNSFILVFDKSTGPVAALFSSDRRPRQITLGLAPSQFQVLDMMGNGVSIVGSTVPYGRIPVYIKGVGITAAGLKSALAAGVVATRADVKAPNVSISDVPRGPITENNFRVRWIGLDETSFPNLGEINPEANVSTDTPDPEAIVYSFSLQGYSDWSTWTPKTYMDFVSVPNGSYTFLVRAKDSAGNVSATMSAPIVIGTNALDTTSPTVPTNIATIPVSASQINLSWTPSTDAVGVTGYNIFRNGTQVGTSVAVSFSDTGLAAATLYTYTVVAFDGAGNSSIQSSPVAMTTLQTADTTPPIPGNSGFIIGQVTAVP